MKHIKLKEGILALTANAAPNSLLFESMWPIPHGVSMNSYIVQGDKVAIVDGLCGWDGVPETLFALLKEVDIALDQIDYVVINHMEPDHSGWLDNFKKLRKDFKIIATERALPLLNHYAGITEHIQTVKSGDELDLGAGKKLIFTEMPNIHWPETMATYEQQQRVLMPCDAFGMFGSIESAIFDDQLSPDLQQHYERETLRYYSNILGAFSLPVQKGVAKLADLQMDVIAPGHGIIWRDNPQHIVEEFMRYARYSKGPAKEIITVLWSSMYGATEMAIQPLVQAIEESGVATHVHRIPDTHVSYVIQSVWESSGVVIATPTYEYKMFPAMHAVLDELFKKKALNRKAFSLGSYGWSGGAQKELQELAEQSKCKWEFLEPVEFQGRPTTDTIKLIQQRGRELATQVKEWVASNRK